MGGRIHVVSFIHFSSGSSPTRTSSNSTMRNSANHNWRGVVEVHRISPRRLNDDLLDRQVRRLRDRAMTRQTTHSGWACRCRTLCETIPDGFRYTVRSVFTRTTRRVVDEAACQTQLDGIQQRIIRVGRRWGWALAGNNDNLPANVPAGDQAKHASPRSEPFRPTVSIPADWLRFFSHLFEREVQVRLILDTLGAAIASEWRVRNHCLLWGRPACGKTEILLAVERMLGADAVVKLDATMTSKAGAENLLLELEHVPPILLIEELEKCDPANLPWLLGVLDQRGEVIKTNARIGTVRKEARCLCLATVNDLVRFRAALSGALASRFPHQICCPRPGRAVLRQILLREVHARGGKEEWIDPALDLLTREGGNDPRRAIALLDGRDRLLNGEYQADWEAIRRCADGEADGTIPPA